MTEDLEWKQNKNYQEDVAYTEQVLKFLITIKLGHLYDG